MTTPKNRYGKRLAATVDATVFEAMQQCAEKEGLSLPRYIQRIAVITISRPDVRSFFSTSHPITEAAPVEGDGNGDIAQPASDFDQEAAAVALKRLNPSMVQVSQYGGPCAWSGCLDQIEVGNRMYFVKPGPDRQRAAVHERHVLEALTTGRTPGW